MKAAMTPEEWASEEYVEIGGELLMTGDQGQEPLVVGNRHKLAARCLQGQEFGFTREHVELVRFASGQVSDGYRRLQALAELIEALLPPEGS